MSDWVFNDGGMYIMPNPNKTIVQIHDDGSITLGEGVTLDEASKAFWEHIAGTSPRAKQELLKEAYHQMTWADEYIQQMLHVDLTEWDAFLEKLKAAVLG